MEKTARLRDTANRVGFELLVPFDDLVGPCCCCFVLFIGTLMFFKLGLVQVLVNISFRPGYSLVTLERLPKVLPMFPQLPLSHDETPKFGCPYFPSDIHTRILTTVSKAKGCIISPRYVIVGLSDHFLKEPVSESHCNGKHFTMNMNLF